MDVSDSGARTRAASVLLAVLLMVVLGGLTGCSVKNPHAIGSLERARFWVEQERWQEAADSYEIFVRQNPTDSLAVRAQYEKAQAYMELGEYPLAAVEFQILQQDYPASGLVEDAMFREGECYYRQVGRIERDVAPAYEARLHWLEFSRLYPTSGYMDQVRGYMQEIADLMVRKQLRAVKVYQQLRRHDAAALVLDRVLVDEPTSSLLDEVLLMRARTAERLDDPQTARQMYRRLLDEHPDSPLRGTAEGALARLDTAARSS